MTISEMKGSIAAQVGPVLSRLTPAYDSDILEYVINGVMEDAVTIRNYPPSMAQGDIEYDLGTGIGIFKRVTMARYERMGATGEKQHVESGINRSFTEEGVLWRGWIPMAVAT